MGVLVAGCGYVGARLAALLAEEGETVFGLKRTPAGLPPGVRPISADVTDPVALRAALRAALDATRGGGPGTRAGSGPGSAGGEPLAVVYAVSPGGGTEDAYRDAYVHGLRNLLDALPGPLERLVLVSSTGVYGQDDGRWVDETTDPEPADPTGAAILDGEAIAVGVPGGVVLRLGGIYGPGRTRLVRQVVNGEVRCPPEDAYGNRIHRDDAAAAIRHLLRTPGPDPIYLGVDQDPAPLRQVYQWIARRAGAPDPCREPSGNAHAAPPGRPGRRGTNKRCSSRRLTDSGFEFRYPTYREGYAPLVDELMDPPST
jgi:nucleoside-diphosphate-sugar epimerase